MGQIGAGFKGSIFNKDFPMVIATNRASAVLLPVRLRYDQDGYVAGQVLARHSDGFFEKYASGGASGTDVAAAVLFESHPVEDFDSTNASTGSTMAVGIFGGCTLYEDKLIDLDSDAKTDLGARTIIDASGVNLLKF